MAEIDNNAKQVFAAAISANTGGPNSEFGRDAAKVIQYAMGRSVERAYQDGVTEPEAVRARMMYARERAKDFLRELDELVYPEQVEEGE